MNDKREMADASKELRFVLNRKKLDWGPGVILPGQSGNVLWVLFLDEGKKRITRDVLVDVPGDQVPQDSRLRDPARYRELTDPKLAKIRFGLMIEEFLR